MTKEGLSRVFFAISVLLAGHLLYVQSIAKEQRRPAAPCGQESQEVSMITWKHLTAWSLSKAELERVAGVSQEYGSSSRSVLIRQV